jgi:hypothetical protein
MSRDTYALNQSLEFIRSSLSNLDVASQFECEKGQLTDKIINWWNHREGRGEIGGVYLPCQL